MRYKVSLCILFILAGCTTTQRIPMLYRIENDTTVSNNQEVKVDYKGLYNQNYKFKISIHNKSNDSIFVTPSSFKYSTDSTSINAINPEERIEELELERDGLINEKNPYSLADKSVKEIVVDGLVTGTIGLIFGIDPEEMETQREYDEDYWYDEHYGRLKKVNKELYFWNNDALLPCMIPPKAKSSGQVLFPVSSDTNEIRIEIQLQDDLYNFRFVQRY